MISSTSSASLRRRLRKPGTGWRIVRELGTAEPGRIEPLLAEAGEILIILVASSRTARARRNTLRESAADYETP
jgi:hypothetical protein